MIQFTFNDEESTFGGEIRIKDRFMDEKTLVRGHSTLSETGDTK
jgi:hypothetical protein